MAKPKRTFSGQEGQRSVGTAGPVGISYDLDNLFAALDPDDTFKDGTPGGIGEENLRTGSISDRALGEKTVDQSKSPSSNTGLLTDVLSWFGNMFKKITGETNWFDTPATTLKAAKAHIDANAPHSGHINAINNIQGGNITLKAGANVAISQNAATKEVTIATSGTIAPSAHASSHATGGADRITPASIGAATSNHTHTPASIGAVPAVPGKGLSTNDFTTALLNKLNGLNIKVGTYSGASSGSLNIPLGFTPTIVIIINLTSHSIAYKTPLTSVYVLLERKLLGWGPESQPIYGVDMEPKSDADILTSGETLTVAGSQYEAHQIYAYIAL